MMAFASLVRQSIHPFLVDFAIVVDCFVFDVECLSTSKDHSRVLFSQKVQDLSLDLSSCFQCFQSCIRCFQDVPKVSSRVSVVSKMLPKFPVVCPMFPRCFHLIPLVSIVSSRVSNCFRCFQSRFQFWRYVSTRVSSKVIKYIVYPCVVVDSNSCPCF